MNECMTCPAGSYALSQQSTCTACPSYTTSVAGSQSASQCLCVPGYTKTSSGCTPCAVGSYKDSIGDMACIACVEAATCAIGTYKPDCPAASLVDTQCVACMNKPNNSLYTTNGGSQGQCKYQCAEGYKLNCETNTCQICQPGSQYYSPLAADCKECPVGGKCDGSTLQPKVVGSAWGWEDGILRIQSCPAGYILIRSPTNPQLDDCSECPPSFYSPVPASYTAQIQSVSSPFAALLKCLPCEMDKVDCPGGSQYIAKPGYWTLTNSSSSRRAAVSNSSNSLSIPIYRCPPDACEQGNNCSVGRTGVLCALCAEGYFVAGTAYGEPCPPSFMFDVMAGAQCKPCSGSVERFKKGGQALFVLVMVILWYVLILRPLLGLSKVEKRETNDVTTWTRIVYMLKRIWEYLRLLISFLQVTSSFANSYNVPWPAEVLNIFQIAAAFK
eukprot:280164-Hanusia_phi.AAC.1